jgi:hypothetical protein
MGASLSFTLYILQRSAVTAEMVLPVKSAANSPFAGTGPQTAGTHAAEVAIEDGGVGISAATDGKQELQG